MVKFKFMKFSTIFIFDLKLLPLCSLNVMCNIKKVRNKKRHILLPVALLALFLSYYAGISLFAHTHVVNGTMIVHSHPYSGNTHSHNTTQILAFDKAGHFQSLEVFVLDSLSVEFNKLYELDFIRDTYRCESICFANVSLRAPPYC